MNKSFYQKTSGLGAPRCTQMAATAIPAWRLFYMICCKAYCILLGRATVLFCTCILPHIQMQLPNICQLWPSRRLAAVADRCRTARTYDAPRILFGSDCPIISDREVKYLYGIRLNFQWYPMSDTSSKVLRDKIK
jgi:hypothetical protein